MSCGSLDRRGHGYLWPSALGSSQWEEAGEPGIKASLGHGAAPVRGRAGGAMSQWRRGGCVALCSRGVRRVAGEWEGARLQSGFGAGAVITPDSVWLGIQWCTRPYVSGWSSVRRSDRV